MATFFPMSNLPFTAPNTIRLVNPLIKKKAK